jgi:uncharacterized protein
MGLFQKHCEKCGKDVDKNTAPKRFGKYFCCEEHANAYEKDKEEEEQESKPKSGGCCG